MKKSEMVRRMAEYWLGLIPGEDPTDMYDDPDFFDEVKDGMEKLLGFLEYKGMLPPKQKDNGFFIPEVKFTPKNEWDEE